MTTTIAAAERILEGVVLTGAAIMALAYGLRRVYRLARNIDQLVEQSNQSKEDRATLAADLRAHILAEEARLATEDAELAELKRDVKEIVREIRPNGGSSIKDVVNQTNIRVAVLEQWQKDHGG